MITGYKIGHFLTLPALRMKIDKNRCIHCEACTKRCPMSLDVHELVKIGKIENLNVSYVELVLISVQKGSKLFVPEG